MDFEVAVEAQGAKNFDEMMAYLIRSGDAVSCALKRCWVSFCFVGQL
jgi:hypothetical protein